MTMMETSRGVEILYFDWVHGDHTFSTIVSVAALLLSLAVVLSPLLQHETSASKSKLKASPSPIPNLVLPPGPRPWPLVGSVLAFGREPLHQTLGRWAHKHGPIMTVYLGPYPWVVVSNGEVAKELFMEQDQNFSHRHYMTAGKYLGFDFRSLAFATYGDRWRNIKKIYNSSALSPSSVQRRSGLRERELKTFVSQIHGFYKAGEPVNIYRTFRHLSMTILLAMIFGKNEFGMRKLSWLGSILTDFAGLAGRLIIADFFPALRRVDIQGVVGSMRAVQDQMTKCTVSLIDELRQRSEGISSSDENQPDDCLADVLLKMEIKGVMTMDDVTMAIFDIIIGGTEPPAIAMDWMMAELLRHPEIMRRAQEEIDSVVGKDCVVTEKDIPNLPYVQNIVKESLRLHPSAPLGISHVNMKPCKIKSYDIPARTSTIINLWGIGRDPNRWPNPLEFNPDRFSQPENSTISALGHHHELIPFSAGRRGCPGMHLATATLNLVVATLLHSFDCKPYGTEPGNIDMKEAQHGQFICQRQSEILCSVTPRLHESLYHRD